MLTVPGPVNLKRRVLLYQRSRPSLKCVPSTGTRKVKMTFVILVTSLIVCRLVYTDVDAGTLYQTHGKVYEVYTDMDAGTWYQIHHIVYWVSGACHISLDHLAFVGLCDHYYVGRLYFYSRFLGTYFTGSSRDARTVKRYSHIEERQNENHHRIGKKMC